MRHAHRLTSHPAASTPLAALVVGLGLVVGLSAIAIPSQAEAAPVTTPAAAPIGDASARSTPPTTTAAPQPDFQLALPGKSWGVSLGFSGFTISKDETKADHRRYAMASQPTTGLNVSATLEQMTEPASSAGCIAQLERLKTSPLAADSRDMRLTTTSTLPTLEYTVPTARGIPVAQRHVHLCYPKENVYLDLHLSKVHYTAADDALFRDFLQTVHIEPVRPGAAASAHPSPAPPAAQSAPAAAAPSTSTTLFATGSKFYLEENYPLAITYYQQALDLERANPQLDRITWRVLVDNLGMAYGMSGKLDLAQRTFEYGIAEDHTYPMFHYNLACTFAERRDRERAMQSLRTAFRYRAHHNPGEPGVPDPRRDRSFQQLLKQADFRRFVDQLMALQGS